MWGSMSAQRPFGPSVLWFAHGHWRAIGTKVWFGLVQFAAYVDVYFFSLSNQLWGEVSSINLNKMNCPFDVHRRPAPHLLIHSIKDKEAVHRV